MNNTLKTALLTLIILGISFGIIFTYVYAFESGFLSKTYYENHSENIDSADKKIVIIGSSQIAVLKPSEISKLLSDDKKFGVYNLFENADMPLKRLKIINEVIEKKPDLVLYGIGLNSFGWGNISNIADSKKCIKVLNDEIPNETKKIIQKKSNSIINEQEEMGINFEKSFFKTINPKQLTIEIIKKILFNTDNSIIERDIENISSIKDKNSVNDLERINSKDFGICIENYENQYNALRKIIKILKQNEIDVILFIPPYDVEFFTYMPENVENALRNTIYEVANENEIQLHDLSNQYDGKDIFKDITHLDEKFASVYFNDIVIIIKNQFD